MLYVFEVKVSGNVIFSHDILLIETVPFDQQIKSALDTFHKNFPEVRLLGENVSWSIYKKP